VSGLARTTTAYDLMGYRLITPAREATYTEENIRHAFEATGIWPLNGRRVLDSRARSVAPASLVAAMSATPRHARAVYRLQSNVVRLISRDTPRSREARTLVRQLGKAAERSLAEGVLKDEMIRIRLNSKSPSAEALEDRKLTKARVIDQDEVVALREAREAQDAEKQRKVPRQRKPRSVAPSSSTIPATPPKRSQKSVGISEKVTVNLASPEGSSSEDGWGTDPEEAQAPNGEYVDVEEILRPHTPTSDRNKGKQIENKPRVVTRSGRVVKIVDKDKF